jgi:uncharacterized OB-fold protein
MATQVPFKEGFLTTPLSPLENVRLKGIKCQDCGCVVLGKGTNCINCTGENVVEHVFSKTGKVHSFTFIRTCPPPPYPKDSFKPFPAGWVETDDGLMLISEITNCTYEELDFGKKVELVCDKGWTDEQGNDVIMYKFKLIK